MPVLTDHRWSPSDLALLPDDGNRYECVDGVLLVTPAPGSVHQALVMRFCALLSEHCGNSTALRVLISPADIQLASGTTVQPDVFVYYRPDGGIAGDWKRIKALAVAVEILSPGSRRHDRVTKRAFYQRMRVDEYWIADPEARVVERWRPSDREPEICTATIRWSGLQPAAPLVIDLVSLFAAAHSEP